ncbi:hypothetical protein Y1Q_0007870 [Alligator mississippiensis]|uniref:Uncharacterized protein n=1 Tax=Alligator mississippiensis TaxID=8496 RepID=A0A151NEM7_ALLMI|nr:hypothetical protein Y1Q_0007870 [Alligator mississippiensis]
MRRSNGGLFKEKHFIINPPTQNETLARKKQNSTSCLPSDTSEQDLVIPLVHRKRRTSPKVKISYNEIPQL